MKKVIWLLLVGMVIFLTGCLNNKNETDTNVQFDKVQSFAPSESTGAVNSEIKIVPTFSGITVENGISAVSIIAQLPKVIPVTLANKIVTTANVTWSVPETFNSTIAGAYTFTGTLFTTGANHVSNVKVTIVVTIKASATIVLLPTDKILVGIATPKFTKGKEAYLEHVFMHCPKELPAMITGKRVVIQLIWNIPVDYSPTTLGKYIFTYKTYYQGKEVVFGYKPTQYVNVVEYSGNACNHKY